LLKPHRACVKKKNYNLFFKKIIIKNNQIPNKALREIKGEKKKKKRKGTDLQKLPQTP
jgi:hypothetical protein